MIYIDEKQLLFVGFRCLEEEKEEICILKLQKRLSIHEFLSEIHKNTMRNATN